VILHLGRRDSQGVDFDTEWMKAEVGGYSRCFRAVHYEFQPVPDGAAPNLF